MTQKTRLRRPSRAMMLAVNAAIDRRDKEVARLMKEHDLDPAELEQRLLVRDGKHYDLDGGSKRPRREVPAQSAATPTSNGLLQNLNLAIDGRTSVAKLFRIIDQAEQLKAQAQQELKRRPAETVEPVKNKLAEIELLRREREKLEERMRAAEEGLG